MRKYINVISGLEHNNGDGPGDHARATATFLNGAQAKITGGEDIRLGRFVEKLTDTQDGMGQNLANRCMIVYGGAIADGNRHNHNNLPVILAGGPSKETATLISRRQQCVISTKACSTKRARLSTASAIA